jgi:hypothetical protein
MLRAMPGKHTILSAEDTIGIPNGFITGGALGNGESLFDTLVQGMRELSIPVGPFGITSLSQACSDYTKCNQDSMYDS